MLNPSDFEVPSFHPWGMLEGKGLANVSQSESFLVWMLEQCIRKGSWGAISTLHDRSALVRAGLVTCTENKQYKFTEKAIGLLYSYYGKRVIEGVEECC